MNDTERAERARNAANRRWALRKHVLRSAALLLELYRDSGWKSLYDEDGTEDSQFTDEDKRRIAGHLDGLIEELKRRSV